VNRLREVAIFLLRGLVRAYQLIGAYFLGGHCRFEPHCSAYAMEALETHGPLGGSWLALRRVCRCGPGGGHGYDPVPPASKPARPTVRKTTDVTPSA